MHRSLIYLLIKLGTFYNQSFSTVSGFGGWKVNVAIINTLIRKLLWNMYNWQLKTCKKFNRFSNKNIKKIKLINYSLTDWHKQFFWGRQHPDVWLFSNVYLNGSSTSQNSFVLTPNIRFVWRLTQFFIALCRLGRLSREIFSSGSRNVTFKIFIQTTRWFCKFQLSGGD